MLGAHSPSISASLAGSDPKPSATAVHICLAAQLLNATPMDLRFRVSTCEHPSPRAVRRPDPSGQGFVDVDVPAFSVCDLPRHLDPSRPLALRLCAVEPLASFDDPARAQESGGVASARSWVNVPPPAAPLVPRMLESAARPKEVLLPMAGDGDRPEAVRLTVQRGGACRVSCARWLVDRTGMRLRALCTAQPQPPPASAAPLPVVQGMYTLLDAGGKDLGYYYLAMPALAREGPWAAIGQVRLPVCRGPGSAVSCATLRPSAPSWHEAAYEYHVCLRAERVHEDLAFGAECQVISVLPQVVVYNELPGELLVRTPGDPGSEVAVAPQHSASFLRWRATGAEGARPGLALQFRPLGDTWSLECSEPVGLEGRGSVAMSLAPGEGELPSALRLFTAEVSERGGVTCLAVRRGVEQELQHFSRPLAACRGRPLAVGLGQTTRSWKGGEPWHGLG